MNLRKTKYVIGLAFILVGIAIVVASTLPKATQYYLTVDELKAQEAEFRGKELKVAGRVVPGTIVRSEAGMTWNFQVSNATEVLNVSYRGAMPDTFKEGAEVVVTGAVDETGHLTASQVLAKCASRYEEKLTPTYQTPTSPSL